MKILNVFFVFCIVLLTVAQDYSPEFESEDCPYFMQRIADEADVNISCGWLHVPEDRNNPDDGLMLELFVVQLDAVEANDNAPFFYLEGGPGGSASSLLGEWIDSGIHQAYDIILMDQRGTGLSYPSLNCPEMDESDELDALQACHDRLIDEGIDLNDYSSAESAYDIHNLLVAMDIPEVNLYGSSYGVRLGLTVIRDFPERIRTLGIDAVYPPQVDSLITEAYYGNQAFEQLFNDCIADEVCDLVYPDLRESFYTAINQMNDEPQEIYDYELDAYVEMNGDDFAEYVFGLLYDTEMLEFLPALIDAYAAGEYDYDPEVESYELELDQALLSGDIEPDEYDIAAMEYLEIDDVNELYDYYDALSYREFDNLLYEIEEYVYLVPFRDYLGYATVDEAADYIYDLDDEAYYELEAEVHGTYDDDSEGLYYSVECAEEVPFYSVDAVLAGADALPDELTVLTDTAVETFDECAVWNVETSASFENEPVVSDIPTLIFSGLYDPITPFQWGADTQQYLPNSYHFVFPNVGHGALDTQACANDIVLAFLDNPMQSPDGSCVETLDPPLFYIRP